LSLGSRSHARATASLADLAATFPSCADPRIGGGANFSDQTCGGRYCRARYYHLGLQRFLSEDPLGLDGGLNVFVFVSNNPLRYIDPLGLKALICSRPLSRAGRAFGRHAFIVTDDTTTPAATLSLFPESGVGVPTEAGIGRGDDPNRPDARCEECRPKGKCGDVSECLKEASQQYPNVSYGWVGPNSNTYAARLARKCCANGFPGGLGVTIGTESPLPGDPVLPANPIEAP
jgi:RHS repeat-associated protein